MAKKTTVDWKGDAKITAAIKKLDSVAEKYLVGAASKREYDKALSELEKACEKAGTSNLDFRDFEDMAKDREDHFKNATANASLHHIDKTTWKLVKKEAGIKKSGFLKKADANVGKNIDAYRKSHFNWQRSREKAASGDHVLLNKTIKDGEALKSALEKFVAAKEFKSELAQELQKKCDEFIRQLGADIAEMRDLLKQAQDTSFFKRTLQATFPGY